MKCFFSQKKKNGTQLRTWITKIDKLTNDPSIEGIIINLKKVDASFNKRIEINCMFKHSAVYNNIKLS